MYFIGQHHIMNVLRVILRDLELNPTAGAAMLLDGPSGYGKTTLALNICEFLARGKRFEYYLWDSKEFVFAKRVIFIDEIHRMKNFEVLFPILDQKSHVLVMATNHTGGLPEALRNRCDEFIFTEYDDEELLLMAVEAAKFKTTDENFLKLVRASNRNPRVLKSLVDNFGKYFDYYNQLNPMTANYDEILSQVFQIFDGMDTLSRRYVEVLESVGGNASLSLLSNILHVDAETLRTSVEPNLLKNGKIRISSKGRKLV